MASNFNKARKNKNDEYYTQRKDIEKELIHYKNHFKNKIIYCNCDNPKYSEFWKYFYDNFQELDLKELFATYYDINKLGYLYKYDGFGIEFIKNKRLNEY